MEVEVVATAAGDDVTELAADVGAGVVELEGEDADEVELDLEEGVADEELGLDLI